MAALKLTLKWVEDLVQKGSGIPETVAKLSSARQDVGTMIEKIRNLSHTLYPRILDTLGLVAAVKELGHHAAQHSLLAIHCRSEGK